MKKKKYFGWKNLITPSICNRIAVIDLTSAWFYGIFNQLEIGEKKKKKKIYVTVKKQKIKII